MNSIPRPGDRLYTASDLIAQKEAGYQEARKFCERYEKALLNIQAELSHGLTANMDYIHRVVDEALK